MKSEIKKNLIPIIILILIFFLGILGYIYIEGYDIIDAFYMTSISLSTVGFGEVHPLSPEGKIFTAILIFSGITLVFYILGNLTKSFLDGELKSYLRSRKVEKKIAELKDHYIICGAGRTGTKIINDFFKKGLNFIVIEADENKIKALKEIYGQKLLYIIGDATKDEVLLQSNLNNAKVLISVLSTDADNLFLILSIKDLNKKIKIITRAVDASSEKKLRRAGANFIISPFEIAAERIIATATEDNLISFIDIFSKKSKIEGLTFELVEIKKNSKLIGQSLMEAKIPNKTNLIVIGHEVNGYMKINPTSHELLNINEKLLVLGTQVQIKKLKKIAAN